MPGRAALELRVFCTSNNFFLLICVHIPYMEVYIDIKCILNAWGNITSEFLTSKQRKMFNVYVNVLELSVLSFFLNSAINTLTV